MSGQLSQETIETIVRYLQADKSHSTLLCRSLAKEQRSRLPILPQELIDMIIDYLHRDKITLAACGLVCRGWLCASRHHLFSKIMLSAHKESRIWSLLDLLGGMSNTIAMSVQHLVLCDFFPLVRASPDSGIDRYHFTTSCGEVIIIRLTCAAMVSGENFQKFGRSRNAKDRYGHSDCSRRARHVLTFSSP